MAFVISWGSLLQTIQDALKFYVGIQIVHPAVEIELPLPNQLYITVHSTMALLLRKGGLNGEFLC